MKPPVPPDAASLSTAHLATLELEAPVCFGDIETAHRLLVRAWDPARFAHSPELRAIAEHRQAKIAEAYTWLTLNRQQLDGSTKVDAYAGASQTARHPDFAGNLLVACLLVVTAMLLWLIWFWETGAEAPMIPEHEVVFMTGTDTPGYQRQLDRNPVGDYLERKRSGQQSSMRIPMGR